MRFLDQFDVILLDMNGTFMFGHDRLGPDEDFYGTYRALGGQDLTRQAVESAIRDACEILLSAYEDPAHFDDFPSLREALSLRQGIVESHLELLEQVFAAHELGHAPADHVGFLRDLAMTHQLGVVSNICASPSACAVRLGEVGLGGVFTHLEFSSEGRSIKPSPAIFRRALAAFDADARILFVGDSLDRDIHPARSLGLGTTWIAPEGARAPEADIVVTRLPELGLVVI